jgi:aminoglycoside phosphotransferase
MGLSAHLPADAALPQLAEALDAGRMARRFQQALPDLDVRGCEIEHVKYRPARNCSVSYRLRLGDMPGMAPFEQRVAARFFRSGESARRLSRAFERRTVVSAAGPSLSHWPCMDMVAHWLPNDAKLDALALLHAHAALRDACLEGVAHALTNGRGQVVDHRMELMQVVPELRACARVDLWLRHGADAPAVRHTVYAKCDLERDGGAAHAVLQAFDRARGPRAGARLTPRPLLWQPAAGLHWQEALPGRPLDEIDPAVGAPRSAGVGARLAALHAVPVPAERRIGMADLRARIGPAADLLSRVLPQLRPTAERLAARLDATADVLHTGNAVTLHGDLHPGNILVDGADCAFVDLDSACIGPAAIELGAWVADALYRAVLAGAPIDRAAPAWRAFLSAYAESAGRAADPAALAWAAAHHLLCCRIYRCIANLKPGRFDAVPALAAWANAIAAAGDIDRALERHCRP